MFVIVSLVCVRLHCGRQIASLCNETLEPFLGLFASLSIFSLQYGMAREAGRKDKNLKIYPHGMVQYPSGIRNWSVCCWRGLDKSVSSCGRRTAILWRRSTLFVRG